MSPSGLVGRRSDYRMWRGPSVTLLLQGVRQVGQPGQRGSVSEMIIAASGEWSEAV